MCEYCGFSPCSDNCEAIQLTLQQIFDRRFERLRVDEVITEMEKDRIDEVIAELEKQF
ncbi:hypothetical protein SAMN05444392_103183 [Seinonella peptonophila]|uniref:Uncharacterized protein n=1 Tax=Seinonella peptonophila TaxID=112248 RepID=A0A1M4WEJ6_9BACL|nr:hypothetical protein [Seinonella peptonophila]SHE79607.1 hypothetical protein SAMN05444392_103183 [Seinonella peptonophila]